VRPERRRELVRHLEWTYRVSERRGCAVLRFNRSSHRYRAIGNDQAVLRERIRELAAARVRYGYFRIYILLRREGWKINHKRVYRLYRQEGLSMRLRRPRRHVMAAHRAARPAAGAINENWSMDFVSDALFDGRRIRALTVVDDYSRESLAIEIGQSLTGEQVVMVMNRLRAVRGAPKRIRVDNGPEFVSRALDQWAYLHQVTLDFSRPGKPTDNALVESFNGRLRDECLNTNWFPSLDDAKRKIEAWRPHYNASRPHTSLGFVPPSVFAQQAGGGLRAAQSQADAAAKQDFLPAAASDQQL
jgi:putative transposase